MKGVWVETTTTKRADARKNYDTLVAVARKHLAERGVSTSLEAIAREAGVGAGTLYRHFPDRDHLVFAALNAQGEQLRAAAEAIRDAAPSDARLERWLDELEVYLTTYQGLPESIAHALDHGECSPLAISCREILSITDEFLLTAREHRTVRETVSAHDLFHATLTLAWLSSRCPEQPGEPPRLDGLRAMLRHGYLTSPQN